MCILEEHWGSAQQSAPPPSTCVSFTFPEKKTPTARSLHLGPRLNRSSPACPSSSSDPLYSTPHLVSLLVGPNTTNLKTQNFFFFLCYTFDLCVLSIQQQVVVERYRLLTLKAAWVIGWRTSVSGPPLTDEGAFYMGSTLNIVQVLHVGHCLWP